THLWEALKRLFQYGWDGLVNTFKVFQALFTGDWEELGRLLRERFENTIDAISDIMWHLWDAVGPALIDLAARIVTWWNGIDWRALARKALEELKRGLAEGGQGGGDDPLRLGGLMTGGAMSSGYEAGQRARAAFVKGWQEEGVAADEIFSPEATREQNRLAVAAKKVAQEAAGADRVLGQYAQGINAITRSSDRASGNIRALDLYLAQTRDHLKLDAERSLHFAAGIDALTAAAARNKAGLDAAAQAAQSYATAFAGVQADYVTELPQADEPMVNPEHDVTIRTRISGPTAEQAELAARYNDELEKLRETYAELTGGVGTFGMEQDKLDEKIGAVAAEMDYYQGLLDGIPPTVNDVSAAQQGLAVNVDAVHRALYDQLVQMGAAPEVIAAYAAATGIMSEEQAEAALVAARLQVEIEALATKMAEN
ncbi:MAG TPA: hypothetical protein PK829_15260, partial [Promineifilum sp.]|nr:hypothetical protein [Promineifilum sp.]